MDNGESKLITKKIKVYGIVQGVGFRPLVYRIAKNLDITGTVRNVGGTVEIILQASEEAYEAFLHELQSGSHGSYEIIKLEIEDQPDGKYEEFNIIGSGDSDEISVISPDLPVCPECQQELYHDHDRRYLNPFISCMSCGPRYTIMEELPYDRDNTSMIDFGMCDTCKHEYTSPEDRRYHAQTISCNDCGPYLIYQDMRGKKIDSGNRPALNEAVSVLKSDGILAVKGIGGYHLVCSPFIEETVVNLRKLKGREEKPFAVMFPNLDSIKEYCQVSEEEQALLETKARPIVLLYIMKDSLAPSVNKGSIYCGTFLPYTPLQLLLTKLCGPLIMTSANLCDQPIIKDDEVMLSLQTPYLDGILYHKRRIVRSVDDSVAKIIDGKPQLIRRSRGYVPYPVFIRQIRDMNAEKDISVFAAGGDLKSAFCLYKNGSAVVSQHFGDLEEITVMEEYKKSIRDLSGLLKFKPELAVCDLHPGYYSGKFVNDLEIPYLQVQHHHAHIASVMAEHDLRNKVIGVAFDGTGYGTDGNVWGGEFLICEGTKFIRAGQLTYTAMLGGDESMRDARKTATCLLLGAGLGDYVSDDRKELIKAALEHKINTILNSSMGRLFDGVSSILDIGQKNHYEGECAAFMEREAVLAERAGKEATLLSFAIEEEYEIIKINPRPVLEALCRLKDTEDKGSLALGFHYALAEAIKDVCLKLRNKFQSNIVALSGGVFQNSVLSQKTLLVLKQNGFETYVNLAVPPNDGGISLGQAYIGLQKLKHE